ncbi:RNA polymerase Rpc34 [Chloropicon primus]|uniref:RNA polymerase Rpc34 n=1 Tax=Chloropicon primus TaxID=1764295 RepID=A0A5B8MYJ1_9CHLO|nr:RNA polymerase Rpc34 [Chloropicon primus]UPR05074.1 RNA polymerase Rpc34 [Chloropicon primus]|eukprot:QDZ25878.1 RNA polymerase Rpc34 [Chloropicon primus]
MGIWTKDLRTKAGLQQPQVAKILKFLEQRKLIKSIKWVTNRNRKVYMAFDVQPSTRRSMSIVLTVFTSVLLR